MTIVEAIYEHGVLRPLTPLDLVEQERVQLSITTVSGLEKPVSEFVATGNATPQDVRPIWERLASAAEAIPGEAIAGVPVDGASQHDHYLYGAPKRS